MYVTSRYNELTSDVKMQLW